ncbi:MAG: HDIG domain-containing protein [Flavobacteriaceae bacterium]|nr:HDIG domain-containing protein [Flavobacteriaceae bacterium]
MRKIIDFIYRNQSLLFKGFVYLVSVFVIVYLFPQGGKFKYEFQKGKPWQHENLFAPFDFLIYKSEVDIELEKDRIHQQQMMYLGVESEIPKRVSAQAVSQYVAYFPKIENRKEVAALKNKIAALVQQLYRFGVYNQQKLGLGEQVYLVRNNEANLIETSNLVPAGELRSFISTRLENTPYAKYQTNFYNLLFDLVEPNLVLDENLTNSVLKEALDQVSRTRGAVTKGSLIIAKGEVVEGKRFQVLSSLERTYASEMWNDQNHFTILSGYTVLVALVLLMLLLFLKKYRRRIYVHNKKVSFIFFNVVLMVLGTTIALHYSANLVYVVPLCILPLITKAFFDARLALFVHTLTVLILGFVVPNSFEYIFLQIVAGIITILTITEFYKRANLFISVGQITLVYILGYIAFYIIHEGGFDGFQWKAIGLFALNGMLTLFAQPLIYIYEKTFELVSDVSLLELSDTNSKILKDLSNKAPGTFHHSLQVANLAEAAANEIGANAMLVRVGALYHDIGKMKNPSFFTENQTSMVNPHDEFSPRDSARIIINHVLDGIEMARKYKLPDRIIDFIRTHHGTSLVYYFYIKAKELEGDVDIKDFSYPGPLPFSKETAILMMADSVEAASKSLKEPTHAKINDFVDKIISKQMEQMQFQNANITFKEIELIKKVFKYKLINIYHLRIEYPE